MNRREKNVKRKIFTNNGKFLYRDTHTRSHEWTHKNTRCRFVFDALLSTLPSFASSSFSLFLAHMRRAMHSKNYYQIVENNMCVWCEPVNFVYSGKRAMCLTLNTRSKAMKFFFLCSLFLLIFLVYFLK